MSSTFAPRTVQGPVFPLLPSLPPLHSLLIAFSPLRTAACLCRISSLLLCPPAPSFSQPLRCKRRRSETEGTPLRGPTPCSLPRRWRSYTSPVATLIRHMLTGPCMQRPRLLSAARSDLGGPDPAFARLLQSHWGGSLAPQLHPPELNPASSFPNPAPKDQGLTCFQVCSCLQAPCHDSCSHPHHRWAG